MYALEMKQTTKIPFNKNGQTLVESVLLIPTFVIIVVAITWFSRVIITKQQLVSAARYGTDLIVYTNLNENEIRQEIRNYLTHRWNMGRKLDPAKLTDENIKIRIDGFNLPDADFFNIMSNEFFSKMSDAVIKLANPINHTSYVDISYKFDLPNIFSGININNISIRAHSEVIAKTGCKGDIHKMQ